MSAPVSIPADRIWEGYVNVRAPDGAIIPVSEPMPSRLPRARGSTGSYNRGIRVVLDDCISCSVYSSDSDGKSFRAVPGFDYSSHGLIQIADIWVNAKNQRAIDNVNASLARSKSWCIIL